MLSFRTVPVVLCMLLPPITIYAVEIDGKTYEQWKADLTHPDPSARGLAIKVLPRFGVRAADAVPLLIERTNDQDDVIRIHAILALRDIHIRGTDRVRVVRALGVRVSHDTQSIIRYEAARLLNRFGTDAREALADLVKGTEDTRSWEIREACIEALIAGGSDKQQGPDPRVTDALLLRLDVKSEPAMLVRMQAAHALGALGPPLNAKKLEQVRTALKAQVNIPNKSMRIWSRASLMALDKEVNEGDLKAILGYLDDKESDVRAQAVTALGSLEGKAHNSLAAIDRLTQQEKEFRVLAAACRALERMGRANRDAVETNVLSILQKLSERGNLDEQSKDIARKALQKIRESSDRFRDIAKPKRRREDR
jgi:HEAT repeat protein